MPRDMSSIYAIQKSMQEKFISVPASGVVVNYLGEDFIVYPGVFWPSEDSKAIVQNYSIRSGEVVLDLCTGSGVIAIFSAKKGAKKVLAIDVAPNAVRSAKENVERHGLNAIIEVRKSDMFDSIKPEEKFDVITMNPPFTEHPAHDFVEKTMWDDHLHVQNKFFEGAAAHLELNGRIYMSQSNFGAISEMKQKAKKNGFSVHQIGENRVDEIRTFYAFELRKKI